MTRRANVKGCSLLQVPLGDGGVLAAGLIAREVARADVLALDVRVERALLGGPLVESVRQVRDEMAELLRKRRTKSQRWHRNGRSLEWVILWRARLEKSAQVKPQMSHAAGFSPVWIRRWRLSAELHMGAAGHAGT